MPGNRRYDAGKLKELIIYITRRCLEDGTFGRVKLNKILWYSDFEAFRALGSSITGAKYQNLPEGPALLAMRPILRDLEAQGDIREVPGGAGPKHVRAIAMRPERLDDYDFGPYEIDIVTQFIKEFWDRPAYEVSERSHQTKAWQLTNNLQEIPYAMAVLSSDVPTDDDFEWVSGLARAGLGT